MHISEAEANQLFLDSPLLGLTEVAVLIAFRKNYVPDSVETALLGNIITKGHGCSLAQVHYFYFFEEENQEELQVQIQRFQPILVLIFDSSISSLKQTQLGECELIYLPDLAKIGENLAIKKELWAILKQMNRS